MEIRRVCFIGHRSIGLGPIRERLKSAIVEQINNGCKFFTMGTHGEFDEMALSVCRELRSIHKDIEIEVVLTSYHKIKNKLLQAIKNEDGEIEIIHENYNFYDDVKTIMYDTHDEHFKIQITMSNRQMIDTCDCIICYVNKDKAKSGAKTALNYATKQGLKIVNLYDKNDEKIVFLKIKNDLHFAGSFFIVWYFYFDFLYLLIKKTIKTIANAAKSAVLT